MRGRELKEIVWKLNQQDFVISGNEILEGFKDYSKVSGMDNFNSLLSRKHRRGGDWEILSWTRL